MRYKFGKTVIVALGGSVMFPDEIDWRFLKEFKSFIRSWLKNKKFVIVAGGGRLSRTYQEVASRVESLTNEDKDWLGIHATRLNAHLLRTIFREMADPVVIDGRWRVKSLKYPITIASGWRPGWSTDYISVALAKDFGAPEAVIAGRPAFVYDKDHAKYKNARPFSEISWKEYRKLIPAKWVPGAHAPVDPVAAQLAQSEKLKAIVIKGNNLKNFNNLLRGKEFRGTIIQ